MKKITMLFLVAMLSVSMVFAQGNKESADSGVVELNFIETLPSPSRTALIQSMIDEFEAQNPDIKVNLISPPYEQAENKMTMMLNAGEKLDIVESRDATIMQLLNNKHVISLEKYLADWEYSDDFMDISWRAARTVGDEAYILPMIYFAKGLFVRTDILEEKGIEIPTTIEELYDASVALTDGETHFGYAIRGKNKAWKVSSDLISLANVPNISMDNFYLTEDGQFSYATEEGKAGLQRYVDLYKNAVAPDGINWGFNEQLNAFVSGVSAFLIQDPDSIPVLDQQLSRDKYTVVPVPVGEDTGVVYQDFAFQGLSITSSCEHPDAAWKFISFMVSPENNARFCREYGAIPVFNSVFTDDEYFSSDLFKAWNTMFNNPDVYKFVNYPITSEKFAAWEPYNQQYMQQLLMGNITIDETIAKWQEYWGY